LVEGSNQIFYGTAYYGGGAAGYGVIFTIDSSRNYKGVHNFDYTHGAGPEGGLIRASDGNFYGTTSYGGTNNDGTIYRLAQNGTFTSLYSFETNSTGAAPSDNLAQGFDGKLYGRTYYGGEFGLGTLYSITTNGQFRVLFSFDGTNGANPASALIVGNDGNLYGLAQNGGTNGGDGLIYEITTSGAFDIVARFDGSKGINPVAPMARGEDGNIYGTTFGGGYGDGVIFQLSFTSTTAPYFASAMASNGQINLTASVVPGRSYQLQAATNLTQASWVSSGAMIAASNSVLSVSDALPQTGQKFYRLNLIPP